MLAEEIADVEAITAAELADRYHDAVSQVIDEHGPDTVGGATDLPTDRIRAIRAGGPGDVTVAEAAAILAVDPERPAARDIELEVRDVILLEMSSAILDVDAVAAELDGLDPTAVQQKVEGRQDTTLAEFAAIRHTIAAQARH